MIKLLLATVLSMLLSATTVLSQDVFECGVSQRIVNDLIYNGYKTIPGEWPWHVAIFHVYGNTSQYACGGTLVTKIHVLTAAHCLKDYYKEPLSKNEIFVKLGVFNLNLPHNKETQQLTIKEIHRIDKLSSDDTRNATRNDIGILELNTEAIFSKHVQPACVSLTADLTGQLGSVVGWGVDESDQISTVLKSARLPVVNFYTCLRSDPVAFGPMLDEGIFCAGYTNGTTICNGDSGGGIFFKENGAWHLGGIVSFAIAREDRSDRCFINGYGAFTRIHTYLSWIESVTKLSFFGFRQQEKNYVRKAFNLEAIIPSYIKRREVASIRVEISNLLDHTIGVHVSLFSKNGEIELFYNEQSSKKTAQRIKTVVVSTNNSKPVSFIMRAMKIGEFTIKIEVSNGAQTEVIEHILRVVPESHSYEKNYAEFILFNRTTENFSISLDIPQLIDKGSAKIKFTLDPDILGQTIKNIENLIRLPIGCGEQNMMNIVPNIVVLDYISETSSVPERFRSEAITRLQRGYQSQLKYKWLNGSFRVWGLNDFQGSTFLTAFVASSLKNAAKYISVDEQVVNETFQWLANIQQLSGEFREIGSVFHTDMQGGLRSTNYALTSYVLIAFTENEDIAKQYRNVVISTMKYLSDNLGNISDTYDLALASYGMALGKHPDHRRFFDKLLQKSIVDQNVSIRYWDRSPVNVEIAGYAILTYIANGEFEAATPIMRWLNQQRNDLGGFSGTQDTYVGIKSLAKFAARLSAHRNNYRVKIIHDRFQQYTFDVNKTNTMVTLEQDIPDHVRNISIEISGSGHGFLQIAYQFYQNIERSTPSFNLQIDVQSRKRSLVLKVCVAYIPKGEYLRSNMALVEVFLPSGVVASEIMDYPARRDIRRTEFRFAETSVVVYYDNLGAEEVCFEVYAFQRYGVALQQPQYVKVYDYYNKERFAIATYQGTVLQICDICDDDDRDAFSCNQMVSIEN